MKHVRLNNSNICLNDISRSRTGNPVFVFSECNKTDNSQKFKIKETPTEIIIQPIEQKFWDECSVPYGNRYDWRPVESNLVTNNNVFDPYYKNFAQKL